MAEVQGKIHLFSIPKLKGCPILNSPFFNYQLSNVCWHYKLPDVFVRNYKYALHAAHRGVTVAVAPSRTVVRSAFFRECCPCQIHILSGCTFCPSRVTFPLHYLLVLLKSAAKSNPNSPLTIHISTVSPFSKLVYRFFPIENSFSGLSSNLTYIK